MRGRTRHPDPVQAPVDRDLDRRDPRRRQKTELPLDELEPGSSYTLRMEAYLDVDVLPLPLRPQAYISRDWSLKSDVWEWRLQP